jgi:hypothetical protein
MVFGLKIQPLRDQSHRSPAWAAYEANLKQWVQEQADQAERPKPVDESRTGP